MWRPSLTFRALCIFPLFIAVGAVATGAISAAAGGRDESHCGQEAEQDDGNLH